MPRLVQKLPAYRRHKKSGNAVVTLAARTSILARGSLPSRKPSTGGLPASGLQGEESSLPRTWMEKRG